MEPYSILLPKSRMAGHCCCKIRWTNESGDPLQPPKRLGTSFCPGRDSGHLWSSGSLWRTGIETKALFRLWGAHPVAQGKERLCRRILTARIQAWCEDLAVWQNGLGEAEASLPRFNLYDTCSQSCHRHSLPSSCQGRRLPLHSLMS